MQVTNEEQHIVWERYGLRLHIPPNSLPQDLNQCNVKIEVALSGNFQLPEDGILVSAVYSFSHDLGDKELRRSVTLEMQHCANTSALNNLFVVKAVDVPSKFDIFPGADFTSNDGYGAINLFHFSRFGIIWRRIRSFFSPSNRLNYCATIYYTGILLHKFDFEFYIIRDLDALVEVCRVIVYIVDIHVFYFYRPLKGRFECVIASLSTGPPQKFSLRRTKFVWKFLKSLVMGGG